MEPFLGAAGLLLIALIVLGLVVFMYFVPIGLWVTAFFSGVHLKLMRDLVGMRLRKVQPRSIVRPLITAHKAGIDLSTPQLEAHYLAGGNVMNVIQAIIAAHRAGIDLDFDQAAAIDLAGRDVLEAVQTSVDPKVIDCPDPRRHGRDTLDGVAKDGIQLKARARVTVRTNLKQLIGGATEETIIARVGEFWPSRR